MDKVYEAAVNRAEELQRELKELNDFIALYRRTRHLLGMDSTEHKETLMSSSAGPEESKGAPRPLGAVNESPRKRVVDNPKPADVVSEAVAVLRERGHPMSRRTLHEALKDRDMEVRGADPVKTLGTMLWRSGQDALVQLEGHGYWIKSEPYPPARYRPNEPAPDENIENLTKALGLDTP